MAIVRNINLDYRCQLSCDNNVRGECKLDIIELKSDSRICLSQDLTKINNK